jgi:MFS family permease
VALAQLAPAAVFGPYAGALGDRHPRGSVLLWGYVAQAAGFAAVAAVLLAGAPPLVAYVFAALATMAVTVTRPTQSALLPALARSPEELTAANVVSGWVESAAGLVAPVLTGVMLAIEGPGLVFAVFAVVVALAALAVRPLAGGPPVLLEPEATEADALRAAVATLRAEPAARLLVMLLVAEFAALGALDVLCVVIAVQQLSLGDDWTGYLNAAFGAGGVLAVGLTVTLVGRRRLVPPLMYGIAIWAAALAVLTAAAAPVSALLLLALAGMACVLVDVSGRTLLQRAAPPEVLARVFGLLEGLQNVGMAAGSLLVPLLVALGGPTAALLGVAAILPLIAVTAGRSLLAIDGRARVPVVELNLLRTMPMFAGLAAPSLEGVAGSLQPRTVEPGETLIRQGDPGDAFYAIAGGTLDVEIDGSRVRTVGRGDGVGEIALLRDLPRTATVVAREPSHVFALGREPFLAAVARHAPLHELADARLTAAAPRERSGPA